MQKKNPAFLVAIGMEKPKSRVDGPPPFPGKKNAQTPDTGMEKAPPKDDMPMAGDDMEAMDDQPMSMEDRMSAVESKVDEVLSCVKGLEKMLGRGEPDGDEGYHSEPDGDER